MQNSPWVEQAIQEAWTEARKIVQQRRKAHELAKYADDLVGFETTFGEFYTEDVKRVMLSVRDNPITVAKSGNSVGKTHGSARIALWFYLVYEDAKIYLTAAPPLENLRRLLWEEIVTACRKRPDLVEGHRWRTMSISRTPVGISARILYHRRRYSNIRDTRRPHRKILRQTFPTPTLYRGRRRCSPR